MNGSATRSRYGTTRSVTIILLFFVLRISPAAEIPKMPVPKSPYVAVVYRYADTLLERGRDIYGPQKTGLILSALDRATLQPLTNRPPVPEGVREQDRVGNLDQPLTGSDPQHDQNLLRLLYTLTELTTKTKYREAADAELKWFLEHGISTQGHIFHSSWDILKDEPIVRKDTGRFFRPWVLWDRCFQIAPQASKESALALVKKRQDTQAGTDFAREAGFLIRSCAVGYAKSKENQFLSAIETILDRVEKNVESPAASRLSLAIDCDGAAHHVPNRLAARLRAVAAREDEIFCALSHNVKESGGFLTALNQQGNQSHSRTVLWKGDQRSPTTASVAMMCVSRYDNTGKVGFRKLIIEAADAYLKSLPENAADAWPATLGHAISLQIAAWRHTARLEYFERGRTLADMATEKFFDNNNPLPRASFKSEHYESITGSDTLMLALLELHLQVLHITAVRCPANTIDR